MADICKISKKILDDGNKEFKEIFSYSKTSMIERTIEVPRTLLHQTTCNNIPVDTSEQYYKTSIFLSSVPFYLSITI